MSQTTIAPHTQEPLVTRQYPSTAELDVTLSKAALAQKAWGKVPLAERIAIGYKFIASFLHLHQRVRINQLPRMNSTH